MHLSSQEVLRQLLYTAHSSQFLDQLRTLLNSKKDSGTVFLTHKRYTYTDDATKMDTDESAASTSTYPVILRATDGKQVKLSTIIEPTDQITFQASYMLLLRTSFATSLRKRDKKKEKDRKNASIVVPKVVGPKRGAGRSKRVSTLNARLAALAKINVRRQHERKRTAISEKLKALGA